MKNFSNSSGTGDRVSVSLRTKLLAAFLGVTLACTAIAGALVDRNVRHTTMATFEDRLSYETTMLGQMTATALFGEIDPTDTSLNESVHALGSAVHTELSVIAKDGTVVADSEASDPHALGSQAGAAEIVAARETGAGSAIRDDRMYVARAISRDGQTLGYARSSVPMAEVTSHVLALRWRMAFGSAIALLVAVGLGMAFSSRLVRPIRALSAGARRVGAGDFEHRIDVPPGDEIGELAASFNDMTRDLRRTVAMLDGRNRDMRIVLDNVTQGLLTVDRSCVVSNEKSAIVDKWFGPVPEGATFADYIRPGDPRAADTFTQQWEQLIEGVLPMDLLLDQLPKRAVRGDRLFDLTFTPIFAVGRDEWMDKLLVVVSDVTARVAAEQAELHQREVAYILERATGDRSGVLDFLLGARAQLDELTAERRPPLVEIRRALHTLKGDTALFGMLRFAALCHQIETRMDEFGGDVTIDERTALRQTWERVAQRLLILLGDASQVVIEDEEYKSLLRAILEGAPRGQVARMVQDWRMEPVATRFGRYADQIRLLGRRLEKGEIEVDVSPGDLRLPREGLSAFWAAFSHAVRNAVDHGIEFEQERVGKGKPAAGRIRLSATREDGLLVIRIADDGRGIDWQAIAARATAMGLPASGREDLVAALFADGLSSKATATDISGRGVGLGALREACRAIGGEMTVESESGRGTAFAFHIPLRAGQESLRPSRETERPSAVWGVT